MKTWWIIFVIQASILWLVYEVGRLVGVGEILKYAR